MTKTFSSFGGKTAVALLGAAMLFLGAGMASAAVNTVSYGTIGTGATAAPSGSSIELFTPAGGVGSGYVRLNIPDGIALSAISTLSYTAEVTEPGTGGYAPEVVLNIDASGDSALGGTGIDWMLSGYIPGTLAGDNFLSGDETPPTKTSPDGSFVSMNALGAYSYWAANDARTGFGSLYNAFAAIVPSMLPAHGIDATDKVYSIDFVVGTSGNFDGMRALINSVTLNGVTYDVIPPTGSIVITKYACPDGTVVTRSANGVGGAVPSGCALEAGKTFGYVHGTQTDANAPYPELSTPLTAGGATNGSGVLTIPDLLADGRYLVVETDGSNAQLPAGDILGLYCEGDGDTSGTNDNQELTFVPADETVNCVAYNKAPPTSTVTMCKVDGNNAPLSGWTLILKGSNLEDLVVPTNTSAGINSSSLTNGTSYIATAVGTWQNQGGANPVDAEYSTTDGWTTHVDGYTGYQTDILELQINDVFDPNSNWGAYNTAHTYAQSFLGSGSPANLRVFDGTGTTPDASWYTDNTGTLAVNISEGYASTTGQNGCVTFSNVPYGTYTAGEILQDNWSNVSGTGSVVVNSPAETFTVVNRDDTLPPPPPANACNLSTAPAGFTLQNGTTGNNTVTLAPNTMFVGHGGNDKVSGGDGNYIVCTGSGNDLISLGNGDSTIDAGGGNNTVTTGNGAGSITTGGGNDTITTGNGAHTINAGGGNNTVTTGNGDQVVTTGAGNDKITTGNGAHTINAGGGNNTVTTGNGDQVVTTGAGNDTITTGSGNDTISAGGGNNTVKSWAGNDTITTGGGNDSIDAGADTDSCSAGGGSNTVVNCSP